MFIYDYYYDIYLWYIYKAYNALVLRDAVKKLRVVCVRALHTNTSCTAFIYLLY